MFAQRSNESLRTAKGVGVVGAPSSGGASFDYGHLAALNRGEANTMPPRPAGWLTPTFSRRKDSQVSRFPGTWAQGYDGVDGGANARPLAGVDRRSSSARAMSRAL